MILAIGSSFIEESYRQSDAATNENRAYTVHIRRKFISEVDAVEIAQISIFLLKLPSSQ